MHDFADDAEQSDPELAMALKMSMSSSSSASSAVHSNQSKPAASISESVDPDLELAMKMSMEPNSPAHAASSSSSSSSSSLSSAQSVAAALPVVRIEAPDEPAEGDADAIKLQVCLFGDFSFRQLHHVEMRSLTTRLKYLVFLLIRFACSMVRKFVDDFAAQTLCAR
jgi:hypothetical protein